jgi:MOSC domain-containing protein YiiM
MSVNVGLPREIKWRGETVHTAIWKEPTPGRRLVRRLNVDGDGQGDLAGHGGEHRAMMVYQMDSYHAGRVIWAAPISASDSSAKTSLSRGYRTTR